MKILKPESRDVDFTQEGAPSQTPLSNRRFSEDLVKGIADEILQYSKYFREYSSENIYSLTCQHQLCLPVITKSGESNWRIVKSRIIVLGQKKNCWIFNKLVFECENKIP